MSDLSEKAGLLTSTAASTDTQSLMGLAGWYRAVAYEHHMGREPGHADTPGPSITAVQLEWAALEIDRLREALGGRATSDTYHTPGCRWEQTTDAECEYRSTHHYCPHPEHDCNCDAASRAALQVHIKAVEDAGYIVTHRSGSDE